VFVAEQHNRPLPGGTQVGEPGGVLGKFDGHDLAPPLALVP
jgi:hypothetical protein